MLFEIDNLTKVYGKHDNAFTALDSVSLTIKKSETVAIIGKSGSGKSTLMHIMAALDTPTSGTITLNGKPYGTLGHKDLNSVRNKTFGFVFQQFFLNPKESVLENVALPLKIAGLSKKERDQKAAKILMMLGLENKMNNKAVDLSGGQKQRVCIARAMVTDPEIIFADEPTGNLDTENGQQVIDALFELNKKQGKTLIIVTHDEDIAKLCDRRVRMKDGKIESSK